MTNPRDDLMALAPCPFCGGEAERIDIPTVGNDPELGGDPNAGGSCISCKRCAASTALHFDRKENLYSSWNDRAASRPAPVDREAVARAVADRPWEEDHPLGSIGAFNAKGRKERDLAKADRILSLLHPAEPVEPPGMTDLMVTPESLDAFMEANPLPDKPTTPDTVGEPVAWRVLVTVKSGFSSKTYNEYTERLPFEPLEGSGVVVRSEPEPLYTHPPKSPDISATVLAERERCAIEARQYVSAHGHHCFWGGSVIDYGWDKEQDKRMRKFIGDIALGVEKAIRQLPTERGDK